MAELAAVEVGPVFVLRGMLPGSPCRAVTHDDGTALWMGPDEWLLLGDADPAHGDALVDVSHRDRWFDLSGGDAADLLACGVPLDLDARAFPIGMCTRTIFEKAGIVLWRRGKETWRIGVARSFAPYVRAMLEAMARANAIELHLPHPDPLPAGGETEQIGESPRRRVRRGTVGAFRTKTILRRRTAANLVVTLGDRILTRLRGFIWKH